MSQERVLVSAPQEIRIALDTKVLSRGGDVTFPDEPGLSLRGGEFWRRVNEGQVRLSAGQELTLEKMFCWIGGVVLVIDGLGGLRVELVEV